MGELINLIDEGSFVRDIMTDGEIETLYTPASPSMEVPTPIIDTTSAFHLLGMKQHVDDMRDMREEIIGKQVNVLNNDEMSDHLDRAISRLTVKQIKLLTPYDIDLIYTMNGEPIVLDIEMENDHRAFEFKRDFLIYKKESSIAVAQIDESLVMMESEMAKNESELNNLLTQFGDLSAFIRQKLVTDFDNADTEESKNKFKCSIESFDDALHLNTLFNHYTKFSTMNTIRDYSSHAERMYEKYMKTMKKLNIKIDLTRFDGLELKHLPEKYHQYPNLFLFAVIKYFAYRTDSATRLTDGIFLTQFTVYLKSLFSDNFTNIETKDVFIKSIQRVLDLFYKD